MLSMFSWVATSNKNTYGCEHAPCPWQEQSSLLLLMFGWLHDSYNHKSVFLNEHETFLHQNPYSRRQIQMLPAGQIFFWWVVFELALDMHKTLG